MTEAEWLACNDPEPMLNFLRGKTSDRKLRLFACACCRRVWHLLSDVRSRWAVDVAERYAEGKAGTRDQEAACAAALGAVEGVQTAYANIYEASRHGRYRACLAALYAAQAAYPAALYAAANATEAAALPPGGAADAEPAARGIAEAAHCQVLRDLFGLLPFRPVTITPEVLAWNDGTVGRIVEVLSEERVFDRLPILADALEEAGCDNADVLAHCRSGGEHVRGCWVLDLLLGKA